MLDLKLISDTTLQACCKFPDGNYQLNLKSISTGTGEQVKATCTYSENSNKVNSENSNKVNSENSLQSRVDL